VNFCWGNVIALLLVGCSAATTRVAPDRFAVLMSSRAEELLSQCSRPAPEAEGTWQPSISDIAQLETDLPHLVGRKARGCCIRGERLRDVNTYFRQYVGVVISGRKLIYINAFPMTEFDDWPPQVSRPAWREEPIKVCDGGSGYWGALYDPVRRSFSDLAFNGIG